MPKLVDDAGLQEFWKNVKLLIAETESQEELDYSKLEARILVLEGDNTTNKTNITNLQTGLTTLEGKIPTKTSQLTNDSDFATTTYVDTKVTGLFRLVDHVASLEELPENPSAGDVYIIDNEFVLNEKTYPAGSAVAYDEKGHWDVLSGVFNVDLSDYAKVTDLNALETRVTTAESAITSLQNRTTTVETDLQTVKSTAESASTNASSALQTAGTAQVDATSAKTTAENALKIAEQAQEDIDSFEILTIEEIDEICQ